MNLSIVIPVFNQLHFTQGCLASLEPDIAAGIKVVVINNGSTDGTAEFLATQSRITVINNVENRGCAPAWNQGVKACSTDWIVVLNNDTLLGEGWLSGLVNCAERNDLGVVTPGIREGELNYDFAAYARDFTSKMHDRIRLGEALGICFMVHKRVFDAVGLFDENFRIGQYEDADFFMRAQKAGFRLGITGAAFIHHFGSATQKAIRSKPAVRPYEAENRAYYRRKWHLVWWRRKKDRLLASLRTARWTREEHGQHGHSLFEKWIDGRLTFH